MGFVTITAAVYLIFIGAILETKNFRSAFLFRFLPIFLGIRCLFVSGKLFGIL